MAPRRRRSVRRRPCRAAEPPATFALETYARCAFNYYERLVDAEGLPYFNVFCDDPAEAAHDWPDFGDVMPRQFQALVMARRMTGERLAIERTWFDRLRSYLDPASGLLVRPACHVTAGRWGGAVWGDQGLTLYAFATAYLDEPQDDLAAAMRRLVDGMARMPVDEYWIGFAIKSLMVAGRAIGYEPAFALAERLVRPLFAPGGFFPPDNRLPHAAHMHGTLRTLVGAADWALHAGDAEIYARVAALYGFVRTVATRFGFLPEVFERRGDIVGCETCALMDLLGTVVTLANHGHAEWWGDVERFARNHLVESQVRDVSWLRPGPARPDTAQFTWREVGARAVGAYAGWSSPNHILAADETLHWGGPELRGKTRALQNCCGGSGTHALFLVWKNAARFDGGRLTVHLHVDKLLPQAEIRGHQPYDGRLTLHLKEACDVAVRIPEFTCAADMKVRASGAAGRRSAAVRATPYGHYLQLGRHAAGAQLTVTYPLPVVREEIAVGNPGFRQYPYRVTWKGDTVVRLEPLGREVRTGYSEVEKRRVRVYFGKDGPGRLYRREHLLRKGSGGRPVASPIHLDSGSLDLWRIV